MNIATHQTLRVLPSVYSVRRATVPEVLAEDWLALIRAPEGLTAIVEADRTEVDPWVALYSGDEQHGLDVPGVLSLLLAPLAGAGVPVFVASTYNADLLLVPLDRLADAIATLTAEGHIIDPEAHGLQETT